MQVSKVGRELSAFFLEFLTCLRRAHTALIMIPTYGKLNVKGETTEHLVNWKHLNQFAHDANPLHVFFALWVT